MMYNLIKEVGDRMTVEDMYEIIDQEALDRGVLEQSGYGTIDFYMGKPGEYHIIVNGERGPIREFHGLTESEACNLALQFVRSSPKSKAR